MFYVAGSFLRCFLRWGKLWAAKRSGVRAGGDEAKAAKAKAPTEPTQIRASIDIATINQRPKITKIGRSPFVQIAKSLVG
jgi:hypothetical protein